MSQESDLSFFFDVFAADGDNKLQKQKLRLKEGERREVCILFADVKNSTVLGCKLDPEMYQARMDELMKRFTKCVTHYGGFVDKYMGDGIMALFGAKQASEQDTERAILCGFKMIDQLNLYNRRLQTDDPDACIDIRIGINTGLVVVGKIGEEREGDFTVTGTAVNLAQRMESNAPAGKMMLPYDAMKTVDRFFNFEHFGKVRVKGFAEEIDCYTVLGHKQEKGQRWYRKKSVFAGREEELKVLERSFLRIAGGAVSKQQEQQGLSIIGIKADAGMGKTRLANEFCNNHQNDVSLICATASGIIHTPFHLFTNLIEREFHLLPGDSAQDKKDKFEAGYMCLFNSLTVEETEELHNAKPLVAALMEVYYPDPRLQLHSSELIPQIMVALQLVISKIVSYHQKTGFPVLMIFDDLHWMDDSSEAVLLHLLDKVQRGSEYISRQELMIILLYRADCAVFNRFLGVSEFQEIELEPLNDAVMESLIVSNTDGKQLSNEALNKVKELSLGNPFYLEEWCNLISDMPQTSLNDIPVPPNLNALILSRLDLLEKTIRLLLQKASVIGQEFFVDILNWIEDKLYDPIDVRETLQQLESQAFILRLIGFDYTAYFFKHITTRDVAYKTLLVGNRTILHKLAAEAIEALYPERGREFVYTLADHYHKAAIRDKAIFYLSQAAAMAQKMYSNRLAIELWQKLLSWLDSENTLNGEAIMSASRVRLNIVEVMMLVGKWDDAAKLLEVINESASGNDDVFDCVRLMGILAFRRGELDVAYSLWEKCMLIANDENEKLAVAHSNMGIWLQHNKDYSKSLEHHTQSLHYAELVMDALRVAKTQSNIGLLLLSTGSYDEAKKAFNTCLEMANEHQFMALKSIVLGNLGFLYHKTGDLDAAYDYYQQKLSIVEKMDDKAELIKVLGNIGNIYRDKGFAEKALDFYKQVLILKIALGSARDIGITLGVIAEMNYRLVRYDEAIEFAQRAIDIVEQYPQDREKYQAVLNKAESGKQAKNDK